MITGQKESEYNQARVCSTTHVKVVETFKHAHAPLPDSKDKAHYQHVCEHGFFLHLELRSHQTEPAAFQSEAQEQTQAHQAEVPAAAPRAHEAFAGPLHVTTSSGSPASFFIDNTFCHSPLLVFPLLPPILS